MVPEHHCLPVGGARDRSIDVGSPFEARSLLTSSDSAFITQIDHNSNYH